MGGLFSQGDQAFAAQAAAGAQERAANSAIDEQRRQFNAMQGGLSPFTQAGARAQTDLSNLLGVGGETTRYIKDGQLVHPDQYAELQRLQGINKYREGLDPTVAKYFQGDQEVDKKRYFASQSLQQLRESLGDKAPPMIPELAGITKRDVPRSMLEIPEELQGIEAQKIGSGYKQTQAINRLKNDPIMQEMMRQGEEGILQNASATGGLRGGNTQAALAQFRPAMLNQRINQQIANLSGLTQMGQSSAAGVGAAGMNMASNIGNQYTAQGDAYANAALSVGQANAQAKNALFSPLEKGIGYAIGSLF